MPGNKQVLKTVKSASNLVFESMYCSSVSIFRLWKMEHISIVINLIFIRTLEKAVSGHGLARSGLG